MPSWSDKDDNRISKSIQNLPNHLYQYKNVTGKRMDWVKEIIADSNFYFSKAREFNDPLDCKIPPVFKASKLKMESYWRRIVKRNHPDDNLRNHKSRIKKLIQDSKTTEGQARMSAQVYDSINKNGILCLTKKPSNLLMWSYYADGHKGVCLRFKTLPENIIGMNNTIFPLEIEYSNIFPEVNYYTDTTTEFIQAILGTKAKAWEHEEEWRFITQSRTGKMKCPILVLDGIILGMKTTDENSKIFKRLVEDIKTPIEILRVHNQTRSFDLEIHVEQ